MAPLADNSLRVEVCVDSVPSAVAAQEGWSPPVKAVVARTRAREVHVVGTRTVASRMRHRNARCFMGGALRPAEFSWSVTDPDRIRSIVDAAR